MEELLDFSIDHRQLLPNSDLVREIDRYISSEYDDRPELKNLLHVSSLFVAGIAVLLFCEIFRDLISYRYRGRRIYKVCNKEKRASIWSRRRAPLEPGNK